MKSRTSQPSVVQQLEPRRLCAAAPIGLEGAPTINWFGKSLPAVPGEYIVSLKSSAKENATDTPAINLADLVAGSAAEPNDSIQDFIARALSR